MTHTLRRLGLTAVVMLTTLTASAYAQSPAVSSPAPLMIVPAELRRPARAQAPTAVLPGAVAPRPQSSAGGNLRFGWDIDVHAGVSWNQSGTASIATLPPGASFGTFSGLQSRLVRSWYFGDGTVLIDTHQVSLGLPSRIIALDPILAPSSVRPATSVPVGVRFGRSLTSRIGLEVSFDLMGSVAVNSTATEALELTRSSFETVFNERLSGLSNRSVSSTATIAGEGLQWQASGALTFDFVRSGRFVPYGVVGGGVLFATGDAPTITLVGDYRFTPSTTQYRQTDTVTVRYEPGTAYGVLGGGGIRWYLNKSSGIRADVRLHAITDPGTVLLNWSPATIPGTFTNTVVLSGSPAIQISTDGFSQTTLSLRQTYPDFVFAEGSGMRLLTSVTVGYFYRFPLAATRSPGQTAPDRFGRNNRTWEIDAHAGGAFGSQPTDGTAIAAFPVGQFYNPGGRPSRRVASWMFGDGSVLFNQVAGARFPLMPLGDRMMPLDPMLTTPSLDRSQGATIGGRVSRGLTPRLRLAFEFDAASSSMTFTQASLDQIEVTRASFVQVWPELLATFPSFFINRSATMTVARTEPGRSWQMSFMGGVEYELWSGRRFTAFASGAAGVNRPATTLPEVTLTGAYQFTYAFPGGGTAPLAEQDLVRVHYSMQSWVPAVSAGGGVRYFLTPKSGIRADLQINISGNSLDTLVDTTPSFLSASPNLVVGTGTNPDMLFSNYPLESGQRGNLSPPGFTNLKTFTASGLDVQPRVTVGYFFRF